MYSFKDIGTHSNHLAPMVEIFMDNTPVYMIILMGRWSSNAFLKYIRHHILEFSKGMSLRVIRIDILYSINDQQADASDLRTQDPNSFAANFTMARSSYIKNSRQAFSM